MAKWLRGPGRWYLGGRNTDETTGFTKRVVIDWRTSQRSDGLKPAITITRGGAVAKLDRGGEARYLLSVDAVIAMEPGEKVSPGDVLARIPLESAKTKDITGGLPRVAELFEARRPKDHAIIAEITGTIKFGRDYKNKRRIIIEPRMKTCEPVEYLIPKGKPFHLQEGDTIEKGEYILDGNPAPHDILAIKGVEELARYLVNEIQEVYRLQGVLINDKHIEVIVRQMLQKVEIINPGDSGMLKDEQLDKLDFDELNDQLVADGKKPATANPVLLGITKASLQTRSFVSAASFQETTRVLTEAAVSGKADLLEGLKENVIVGRLIPAGTGAGITNAKLIAAKRDDLILDERRRQAETAAIAAPTRSRRNPPNKRTHSRMQKGPSGPLLFAWCCRRRPVIEAGDIVRTKGGCDEREDLGQCRRLHRRQLLGEDPCSASAAANAAEGCARSTCRRRRASSCTCWLASLGRRRILEIGTLGGYSTIWLARALPADGKLVTLEYEPRHAEAARKNIERAGFADRVEVRVGAAPRRCRSWRPRGQGRSTWSSSTPTSPATPIYLDWAVKLSRPGTVIVLDNVVRDGAVVDRGEYATPTCSAPAPPSICLPRTPASTPPPCRRSAPRAMTALLWRS